MKNDKIYIGTDERKLKFVIRKRVNKLFAISVDEKLSYGFIVIETEKCVGGTHCFEGLIEALKEYKETKK